MFLHINRGHPSIRAYLTVYMRLSIYKHTTFDVFRQHHLIIRLNTIITHVYKYILKNLDSLRALSLLTDSEVSLGLIVHLITYVWWLSTLWTHHCESICTKYFSQCTLILLPSSYDLMGDFMGKNFFFFHHHYIHLMSTPCKLIFYCFNCIWHNINFVL